MHTQEGVRSSDGKRPNQLSQIIQMLKLSKCSATPIYSQVWPQLNLLSFPVTKKLFSSYLNLSVRSYQSVHSICCTGGSTYRRHGAEL